jgi:hypothetical protein
MDAGSPLTVAGAAPALPRSIIRTHRLPSSLLARLQGEPRRERLCSRRGNSQRERRWNVAHLRRVHIVTEFAHGEWTTDSWARKFVWRVPARVDSPPLSIRDVVVTVLLNRKIWEPRGKPVSRTLPRNSGAAPATVSSELLPPQRHWRMFRAGKTRKLH